MSVTHEENRNVRRSARLQDPTALKEKVHEEFPEYRKTYTELDAEP
jgi:hypothetical protein